MSATIQRTDCGTGWMIFRADGSWYLTVRRRESALEIARELNEAERAGTDSDGGAAEPIRKGF